MSKTKKARPDSSDARGRGVIVLAGEDSNDCKIVAHILRAHIGNVRMVEITDKVRLKGAVNAATRAERVSTLIRKAKGRALRAKADLVGLVVHEDLDGVTNAAYDALRKTIASELNRQSPCDSALALAAFESEAWLLLFPDAFPHVQPKWKLSAAMHSKDTGLLESPKEILKRALTVPKFRESDGPQIAEAAGELGLLTNPQSRNRSYTDFITELGGWVRAPVA